MDVKNKSDTKCIENRFENKQIAALIEKAPDPGASRWTRHTSAQILFDTCNKVLSYRGHPMNSFADRFVETS